LHVTQNRLVAIFQIGNNISDIRAFRWQIGQNGQVSYIDNRGERDIEPPPPYDFEWTTAERSHYSDGRLPRYALFDVVFVSVEGGKLIWRVEDNTELGETVFQDEVEDAHQSLDDVDIKFAQIGTLVLMLITPYGEKAVRGYIFDTRTQQVTRVDALGSACVQLPEDHGIIFPGGYYLTGGDYKLYADNVAGLTFKRRLNAPNGEDVLFVFYEETEGRFAIYSYNLIKKQLETPLFAHGYSLFEDGRLLIFKAESDDPSRIHPMQLWQTPYVSEAYHAAQPVAQGFFSTVGNAEMVRAIAELNFIGRLIDNQSPSTSIYQDIINSIQKLQDSYYWLDAEEAGKLNQPLAEIAQTAELVLVEFEKVKTARRRADKAIDKARQAFADSRRRIELDDYDTPQPFVTGLLALKRQKGRLISLRENRYINHEALQQLD
ncbi:MAG: DNA repair protein, partial [Gammaproteobacteria bacterium]